MRGAGVPAVYPEANEPTDASAVHGISSCTSKVVSSPAVSLCPAKYGV
jgi:hypothetical protein